MKKRNAFTLAEVLITLAIIGIVAAVTIPSVIANAQQQEFKTGLRKAVSVLNEAIQANIALEGETPYENASLSNYIQRHINILKTNMLYRCYDSSTGNLIILGDGEDKCTEGLIRNHAFYTADGMRFEFPTVSLGSKQHFYLHETGIDAANPKTGFLIYHGAPSTVTWHDAFCGSYGLANNPNNTTNTPCIIMVDVNGDKKPNPPISFIEGNQPFLYTYPSPSDKKLTDIFSIMITDEKAVPFGVVAQRAMYEK